MFRLSLHYDHIKLNYLDNTVLNIYIHIYTYTHVYEGGYASACGTAMTIYLLYINILIDLFTY